MVSLEGTCAKRVCSPLGGSSIQGRNVPILSKRTPPRRWPAGLRLAVGAVGFGLVGCQSPASVPGSGVPTQCQQQAPAIQPVKTDILFVVDNSGSMAANQKKVATDLPVFVAELQKSGGVINSFRVGVTTTSVYSAYEYFNSVAYYYYPQGGWLTDIPLVDGGTSNQRYLDDTDPELVPRFALAMTAVGIDGSGQETPFEATRIALQNAVAPAEADGGPANAGFLRDGARLMVVAVSDEDDCSETDRPPQVHYTDADGENFCIDQASLLTPVGDYFTDLQNLPDGQGRTRAVVWGTLAPVALDDKSAQAVPCPNQDAGFALCNIDCPTSNAPGTRLRQMAVLFDLGLENLYSICADSYHDQLLALADIAAVPQTLDLNTNVPDPHLLQVTIVRADGTNTVCTVDNGGILYEAAPDGGFPQIQFIGPCVRRQTDISVTVRMFCAG
jgi:hypothetical protein